MKSSTLRAGLALACAIGLSACGGGSGDLYLQGSINQNVPLTADGLILQNNGGDDLAVPAGALTFQFGNRVSTDDEFNITVKQAPTNSSIANCHVLNGKARANYYTIGQISVYCDINQIAMTVAVNGLTGAGLTLVNGSDKKDVPAGATSVVMATVSQDGPYAVKILNQPAGQTCTVTGGDTGTGTGKVGATPVTSVVVTCTNNAAST